MLEVVNARYHDGYRVWVEFNDGVAGVVDLSDTLWGPVFEPLKDVERFKQFEISEVLHTLAWKNGADLCARILARPVSQSRRLNNWRKSGSEG